jgi:hypothetical protein
MEIETEEQRQYRESREFLDAVAIVLSAIDREKVGRETALSISDRIIWAVEVKARKK